MSDYILQLVPRDPIVARDGRPFGVGQGNRMRSLAWPLPSVGAGSLRTTLAKASPSLDFSGDIPQRLQKVAVAGLFPVHKEQLYLPAPNDAVAEPAKNGPGIETVHRVIPRASDGGCDFPSQSPLLPVMLAKDVADFKPANLPAWWPLDRYVEWLTDTQETFSHDWISNTDPPFLDAARQEYRDHVSLDAARGAAAEGQLFTTAGLNIAHLPIFRGAGLPDSGRPFDKRYAEITLSARVTVSAEVTVSADQFSHINQLNLWHPLGGERRLVHWSYQPDSDLWKCPQKIQASLAKATRIRMTLATPAIFSGGWKPGWLDDKYEGSPPDSDAKLKLVGVNNGRWRAVSGWSLAEPRGPKRTRRMVPEGSVYFFEVKQGAGDHLASMWLQSVCDDKQEQRDGFGLAIWGTW